MFRRRHPVAYSQRGESWPWNTFGTWVGAMERIDERERNMPINSAQVNLMVQIINITSYRGTEIAFEHAYIFFKFLVDSSFKVHFKQLYRVFNEKFCSKKLHPSECIRLTKKVFGHRSNIFCQNLFKIVWNALNTNFNPEVRKFFLSWSHLVVDPQLESIQIHN